jgi:hypothetical protein
VAEAVAEKAATPPATPHDSRHGGSAMTQIFSNITPIRTIERTILARGVPAARHASSKDGMAKTRQDDGENEGLRE